jgi:hypothetical protein
MLIEVREMPVYEAHQSFLIPFRDLAGKLPVKLLSR